MILVPAKKAGVLDRHYMKEESENIIDLGYHRQRMFPTKEEVEAHLLEVSKNTESFGEAEVAGALLILFRDGEIEATRGKEGQFLYALRKEELVRFKVSALPPDTTEWLRICARNRAPILIVSEYSGKDIPIEIDLSGERVFEVLVDGTFISATENELTKRGLK